MAMKSTPYATSLVTMPARINHQEQPKYIMVCPSNINWLQFQTKKVIQIYLKVLNKTLMNLVGWKGKDHLQLAKVLW